jgi:UDP:flavonoid glycosyltransferase YjiC (YdhE family)
MQIFPCSGNFAPTQYMTLFFSVHPKLLAFITHGGANSISEAATAGSPLIAIPLFGESQLNFM